MCFDQIHPSQSISRNFWTSRIKVIIILLKHNIEAICYRKNQIIKHNSSQNSLSAFTLGTVASSLLEKSLLQC